ncbi:hypothetical protein SLEP1_g37885 [Rubroshorea leprosula]|uniref:Retrotransposon Copia-like N-terminal domain-containing protein n=1 Tax=Rubroshorea leprosula TaxID=152421 RepID=A0AAV5KWS4_9ROSI|nr:hypothetical protein SLEP1_g37885 [Rubroshorea leprosula]
MASSDSKTFSLSDSQPSTPIPLFNAVPPTTLTPPTLSSFPHFNTLPTPSLTPTYHASSSSFFSHPMFTISNIKTFIPETLTHDNYIIWKELMIPVFKSKGVYGHIDGTDLCPPPFHPNHDAWVQIDYQILSWIHATISTNILQMIIQPGKTLSAKEAWDAIHTSYQNQLAARKMYVKQGFVSLQKQSSQSMFQYLQSVKKAADNMYGVGECLTDRDIVFQALAGLDAEYSVAKRTIPHRSPFPSFVELQSLLLIEESTLQREKSTSAFLFVNSSAQQVLQTSVHSSGMGFPIPEAYYSGTQSRPDFYGMNRGRGSFYRGGRGNKRGGRGGRGDRSSRGSFSNFDCGFYPGAPTNPGCGSPSFSILLGILPHRNTHLMAIIPLISVARDCPLLIGTNIVSMSSAPTALIATTFPTAPDSKWYIDSGANTHVSSTPGYPLEECPASLQ